MFHPLVLLVEPITPGQQRVLDRLALGESNAQIAVSLFLSPYTVRDHVSQLLAKLGAESRLEAVLTAQELGLVELPDAMSPAATAILALLKAYPAALDELVECGAVERPKGGD